MIVACAWMLARVNLPLSETVHIARRNLVDVEFRAHPQ